MRKEIIGNCTLYLGDALLIITDIIAEHGGFDATISDPPYGINGGSGTVNKKRGKGKYTGIFPDTPEYIEGTIAPIIEICMNNSKRGAITPGGTCSGYYPNPTAIGAYTSPAGSGLCKWGSNTVHPIFFYGIDPRIGKDITPISRALHEAPPKIAHPCPKPQLAWDWLVHKASLKNDLIIDPFMGSGTTGISCVKLDRKFIGIELDEKYFDLSCKRIEHAESQGDMFMERTRKQKPVKFDFDGDEK